MIRSLSPAALLILATGCAAPHGAGYPSLAPRAAETRGFEEPAAPAPAAVTADAALDARIAATERGLAEAAAAFARGAAAAEAAARAAKGAAAGSERWIAAQTSLAELDLLRGAHQDGLDALEELAAGRLQALQPAYPALDRALAEARSAAAAQTRRIDALAAMLAPA